MPSDIGDGGVDDDDGTMVLGISEFTCLKLNNNNNNKTIYV